MTSRVTTGYEGRWVLDFGVVLTEGFGMVSFQLFGDEGLQV